MIKTLTTLIAGSWCQQRSVSKHQSIVEKRTRNTRVHIMEEELRKALVIHNPKTGRTERQIVTGPIQLLNGLTNRKDGWERRIRVKWWVQKTCEGVICEKKWGSEPDRYFNRRREFINYISALVGRDVEAEIGDTVSACMRLSPDEQMLRYKVGDMFGHTYGDMKSESETCAKNIPTFTEGGVNNQISTFKGRIKVAGTEPYISSAKVSVIKKLEDALLDIEPEMAMDDNYKAEINVTKIVTRNKDMATRVEEVDLVQDANDQGCSSGKARKGRQHVPGIVIDCIKNQTSNKSAEKDALKERERELIRKIKLGLPTGLSDDEDYEPDAPSEVEVVTGGNIELVVDENAEAETENETRNPSQNKEDEKTKNILLDIESEKDKSEVTSQARKRKHPESTLKNNVNKNNDYVFSNFNDVCNELFRNKDF